MKLLLHACCGPCSLEPIRLLQADGHELTIAYMNSNIHPESEYRERRDTLLAWAQDNDLSVVEGVYDADTWEATAGAIAQKPGYAREDRCRACYRLRFEEAAAYAQEHGFEGICTTLSVSPYQFTDIIAEELERVGARFGLVTIFKDFRPFYPEATRRSRELGMYRQNYCGCHFSDVEAAAEREERKRLRKKTKAAKAAHSTQTPQATRAPRKHTDENE